MIGVQNGRNVSITGKWIEIKIDMYDVITIGRWKYKS